VRPAGIGSYQEDFMGKEPAQIGLVAVAGILVVSTQRGKTPRSPRPRSAVAALLAIAGAVPCSLS
jgi:hypothetical protein